MAIKIGFIGFGEVGTLFSKALYDGGAEILVYDPLLTGKNDIARIQKRTGIDGIQICQLEDLIIRSDYILSTVTTQVAKEVASTCAKHLSQNKTYIDLNSTSPTVKIEIYNIIKASGADFVEGAILGAVGATGIKTKILTTGEKGKDIAEHLSKLGLNAVYYANEIGRASMFKMLRSIFSKGIENIILELLVAGKRAGIEKDLWEDINDFMSKKPFEEIASNWIQTHALAHERRYHEMVQVVKTMREIGIEPIMTTATEAFFQRSITFGFKKEFQEKPESFERVVEFIESQL